MSRRASTRPASRRCLVALGAGLERLGLGADGGDLVAVGKRFGSDVLTVV